MRRWVDLAYSGGVLLYLMGWQTILLFLGHCLAMYIVSFTRSFFICWIASLCLLMTLNIEFTYSLMVSLNIILNVTCTHVALFFDYCIILFKLNKIFLKNIPLETALHHILSKWLYSETKYGFLLLKKKNQDSCV